MYIQKIMTSFDIQSPKMSILQRVQVSFKALSFYVCGKQSRYTLSFYVCGNQSRYTLSFYVCGKQSRYTLYFWLLN
jgi:rRNA maturation protein Nop10